MAQKKNTIEHIENEVTKDPVNQSWIRYIVYPFIVFGLIATGVSAYIEYNFFNEVFLDFTVASFFIVIAFEGAKIGAIILYEYAKSHQGSFLSGTLKGVTWLLRICLIIFSAVCSFSKISQYMDSPNFEKVFGEEKQRITAEYQTIIANEDTLLQERIRIAKEDMDIQANIKVHGIWDGPRYKEQKKLYETAQNNRDNTLRKLRFQRDSIITATEVQLKQNPKSKNQILVGVYTTFQNIGLSSSFNVFYSLFVLIIAFFTTIILELIIWVVFGFIGVLYEGVFKAKLEGYKAMTEVLEKTRFEQFTEDLKNAKVIQEIKRTFSRGKSKVENFVDSVDNDKNN